MNECVVNEYTVKWCYTITLSSNQNGKMDETILGLKYILVYKLQVQ